MATSNTQQRANRYGAGIVTLQSASERSRTYSILVMQWMAGKKKMDRLACLQCGAMINVIWQ